MDNNPADFTAKPDGEIISQITANTGVIDWMNRKKHGSMESRKRTQLTVTKGFIMKNKKVILEGLDAVIAKLKTESDGSQQHQKDLAAYELIREQYEAENIEAARHTFNFVMDTYLREMLPEECGETLGFKRIK